MNILNFRIPVIIELLAFLVAGITWIISYIWRKIIDKQKIKLNDKSEIGLPF
jgi:hypothetical protein